MAFSRPTIQTIIKRVRKDIKTTTQIVTILRRSFVNAITKAIAGVAHMLHGHLDFLSLQILPTTAKLEFLQRHFDFWGIQKTPATFAELNISISGTPASVILINTTYNRPDGVEYKTNSEATIGADTPAVAQVEKVTTLPDVTSSLAGKFFLLYDNFYVLQRVDGVGADPLISGRTLILVLHDEDDDADTVATNNKNAIDAVSGISASVSTDEVTITRDVAGAEDNIQDGAQPTGFGIALITDGADLIEGVGLTVAIAVVAGENGNLADDELITLKTPISGVDANATVISTQLEADDEESEEAALARLLLRVQDPPDGGSARDYIFWATSVAGVTRAFVFPNKPSIDSVTVSFVEDGEDDIFPEAAKIAEVADFIEEHIDPATGQIVGRPVTAKVFVVSPTEVSMDMTIKIKPNTQTVRDAITAELTNLIGTDAQPKDSRKNVDELNTGTILFSRLNEVVSLAADEEDHLITTPSADFTVATFGEMVSLGDITFQTLA